MPTFNQHILKNVLYEFTIKEYIWKNIGLIVGAIVLGIVSFGVTVTKNKYLGPLSELIKIKAESNFNYRTRFTNSNITTGFYSYHDSRSFQRMIARQFLSGSNISNNCTN